MDYGEYLIARMRRVDEVVLPIEVTRKWEFAVPVEDCAPIVKPITPAERLAGVKAYKVKRAQALHDNAALACMDQPLTLNFI